MAFWEWAAAGAVFVAIVVMCARFMSRGLTTLEDERAECLERIRQMEEKIKEDQKNMASSEHLHIARAGLEDLLRLAGNPADMWIEAVASGLGEAQGEALVLHLPEGELRISLSMRSACTRALAPSAVSVTSRTPRSNRRTPNSCSSVAMRLETAACVVYSRSAVMRKLRSSASSTKVSRNRRFMRRC